MRPDLQQITRRGLLGAVPVGGAALLGCSGSPAQPPEPGPSSTVSTTPTAAVCHPGLPPGYGSPTNQTKQLMISPDGTLLAQAEVQYQLMGVWDVATGELAHRFDTSSGVGPVWLAERTLCWATDLHLALTDLDSGTTHHFPQSDYSPPGEEPGVDYNLPRPELTQLSMRPDGGRVAFMGNNQMATVADPHTCEVLARHDFGELRGTGMTDDALIVATRDGVLAVDALTGEVIRDFGDSSREIRLSADGAVLATCAPARGDEDVTVTVFDTGGGQQLAAEAMNRIGIPLAFSPDGSLLVCVPSDPVELPTAHIWDWAADELIMVHPDIDPWMVELGPNRVLYVGGVGGITSWDIDADAQIRRFSRVI